jgi:hypothetical protein
MTIPRDEAALTPLQQQLLVVQLHLAEGGNSRERELDIARRRVNRIASVLGMVAAAVAMYDLILLATLGRS